MSNLLKQVSEFLDQNESAPSAWCLVRSYYLGVDETPDAEVNIAYERSEGVNDSEREDMLKKLSAQQLADLAALCLEIAIEKIESLEE